MTFQTIVKRGVYISLTYFSASMEQKNPLPHVHVAELEHVRTDPDTEGRAATLD